MNNLKGNNEFSQKRLINTGQQIISAKPPSEYLQEAYDFALQSKPIFNNRAKLDYDNYTRSAKVLHNPSQMKDIMNDLDIDTIYNKNSTAYNNYYRNVIKQDELHNKINNRAADLISKGNELKKNQYNLKNLGLINKYNDDLIKISHEDRRNAIKEGKNFDFSNNNDPFNDFLKDPKFFPDKKDQENLLKPMEHLNNMASNLLNNPNSNLEDFEIPEKDQSFSKNSKDNSSLNNTNNSFSLQNNQKPLQINIPKKSTYKPHSLEPIISNNQNEKNSKRQTKISANPKKTEANIPIFNVVQRPDSNESNISDDVKDSIKKQNKLLEVFLKKLDKKEKSPDLEPHYEQKILELEKNFALNQEIAGLKNEIQRLAIPKEKIIERTVPGMMYPPTMGINWYNSPQMYNPYQYYYPYGNMYQYPTPFINQKKHKRYPSEEDSDFKFRNKKNIIEYLLGDEDEKPNEKLWERSKKFLNNKKKIKKKYEMEDSDVIEPKKNLNPKKKDRKYYLKWFRYASFPFMWKKHREILMRKRKEKLNQDYEQKFKELNNKSINWALKSSYGISPLIDKNKLFNYDFIKEKKLGKNVRKQVDLFKIIINDIMNDLIKMTEDPNIDISIFQFLGEICRERAFIPDYFLFKFEYERLNFSESFGFLKDLQSNQAKMIIAFYFIIKVFIYSLTLNPWKIRPKFPQHPFFSDNLKIVNSFLYHMVLQYFTSVLPLINFDDKNTKEPFKLKIITKPISKAKGFDLDDLKEKNGGEIKLLEKINENNFYSEVDFKFFYDEENIWCDQMKQYLITFLEKAYALIKKKYVKGKGLI